jgi:hypothetical protein
MRGRGHLRRLTVFVKYENVSRLLDVPGIPPGGVAEVPQRTASICELPIGSLLGYPRSP